MARPRQDPTLAKPPAADDAVAIADRLHSAAIHLLRRVRAQDEATGLSAPRLSALSVLVFRGPLTLGQLAAAEQVRPPTITRLVQELEREGLVRRETDREDRRVQRIHATAAGKRLLLEGRARRVAALAESVRSLSPADRRALAKAAGIIERIVREPFAPGTPDARGESRDVRSR
jgi:DNA-binding MarR family transcriptional regulator